MVVFGSFFGLLLSPGFFVSRRVGWNYKENEVSFIILRDIEYITAKYSYQVCWSCRRREWTNRKQGSSNARSIDSWCNVSKGIGRSWPKRCRGISWGCQRAFQQLCRPLFLIWYFSIKQDENNLVRILRYFGLKIM